MSAGDFPAVAVALYAAHHVGDYWVQTDHQAQHKGMPGHEGRINCMWHVLSYVATQCVFLLVVMIFVDVRISALGMWSALAASGVTHYLADRREHGPMFWLARLLPGKADFMRLGMPRATRTLEIWGPCPECDGRGTSADASTGGKCWDCRGGGQLPGHTVLTDNPSLGTGAWALDQSWHIFWGVFVAAILAVTL